MGVRISSLTATTSPADTDTAVIETASGTRKITWANIKTGVKVTRAEWRANTHAGYGGTDTRIPYFTNVDVNSDTASALTVVNNSTNGCKITINTAGWYAVSYCYTPSSASSIGISLNSAQLTTNIDLITAANRLVIETAQTDYAVSVSWMGYLAANDVIRPHGIATGTSFSALSHFSISRVA